MDLGNTEEVAGWALERKGRVARSVKGAGSQSLVCRRKRGNALGPPGRHYESSLRLGADAHHSLAAGELLSQPLASPGRGTEQQTGRGWRGFSQAQTSCGPPLMH